MFVCEQLFWFVFSELESEHKFTRNSFYKKLAEIMNNISNMSEFDLFEIYFGEKFHVIEEWFDLDEELFDYLIQLFLLFIHHRKKNNRKYIQNNFVNFKPFC